MAGLNNAKQNISYVRKLYTGVTNLRPVLINPTIADLKQIGIEAESTRQYTNLELGGKMWSKVVIFLEGIGLEGDKILTNVEFLVSNRVRKSQAGDKTQFASKAGVFSWGTDPSTLPEWFKAKGAVRPAYEGEEDLLNFFIALGNLDTYSPDAEAGFADWSKIASGDVSELKEYIFGSETFMKKDALGNPTVTRDILCLCYVQKDKYMRVFTKGFDPMESVKPTRIIKALDGLLKPLESLESKNINFKKYEPSLDLARESSTDGVEAESAPTALPF